MTVRPPRERFWDLVNGPWIDPNVEPTDCWRWMGGLGQSRRPKSLAIHKPYKRYGRFWLSEGVWIGAHRAALIYSVGGPPDDVTDWVASHTGCDNGLCCNPLHLKWDSPAGNIREAVAKGRLTRDGVRWATTGAVA